MTAPALILLVPGFADQQENTTAHQARKRLQALRPNLKINIAFLDHCPPSGPQVVKSLVKNGIDEIVFVPMDLTSAIQPQQKALEMLSVVKAANPGVSFAMSRPIGPCVELLNLLDIQLRKALSNAKILELNGLVLSNRGCADTRGAALLARRARQWSAHHKLPCLLASNDDRGPNIAKCISELRRQGRSYIAVGSMYMSPDKNYSQQLQTAYSSGAVAVSAPFGAADDILNLAFARYASAAMELLDNSLEQYEDLAI